MLMWVTRNVFKYPDNSHICDFWLLLKLHCPHSFAQKFCGYLLLLIFCLLFSFCGTCDSLECSSWGSLDKRTGNKVKKVTNTEEGS